MKSKKENIQLKDYQKKAIEEIMKKDSITLSIPIGIGKILNTKGKKKSKDRDTR